MAERVLWEHEAGGSRPLSPTKKIMREKLVKLAEVILCAILVMTSIYFVVNQDNIMAIYCLLWAIFLKIDRSIF